MCLARNNYIAEDFKRNSYEGPDFQYVLLNNNKKKATKTK